MKKFDKDKSKDAVKEERRRSEEKVEMGKNKKKPWKKRGKLMILNIKQIEQTGEQNKKLKQETSKKSDLKLETMDKSMRIHAKI